ncbi:MAG: aminotransferase class V-fold PLP-dependent enzyme [Bacteroidota bacterium]
MIYLNNAGTTWPKPDSAIDSMNGFSSLLPDDWNEIYEEGLDTVSRFFNLPSKERFLFTTSCTSALGIALSDFPWNPGDRLVISTMEHHALSRWFYKLQNERGIEGVIIPRAEDGPFDIVRLESELKLGVRMVAISMASNVTGELLPYREVLDLCQQYSTLCLLDGAQTAGILDIDISALKPHFFVFAGHKGPMGPQGIGGLYIDESVSMTCPSAACEITPGAERKGIFPTYCDTGSVNMMALAGMTAGLKWIETQGWEKVLRHRKYLTNQLRKGLNNIEGLSIVGEGNSENKTGAVSIIMNDISSNKLADMLWERSQIKLSAGFQCAPLAHEALGTDKNGTARFSVGNFNQSDDINTLLQALDSLHS